MFYHLNLDDKSYRDIEADAIFQISKECPDWTNYNQADPGILLVGLFSWLKEIQQYEISRLCGWKQKKYLKLLGFWMQHLRPAQGAVSVELPAGWGKKTEPLPRGTRFWAGDLSFETVQKEWPCPIWLIGAYTLYKGVLEQYVSIGNEVGTQKSDVEKRMHFYPFGQRPRAGHCCCFVIDRPFAPQRQNVVSVAICMDYPVARNPIEANFIPLAKLKWEYQSQDGWEELAVDYDTTYAFLQSGKIGFYLQKEMVLDAEYGAYQIRVTLMEQEYDVAPLIEQIHLNEIEVRQQYTYCDYEEFVLLPGTEERLSVKSELALAKYGPAELYLKRGGGWVTVPVEGRSEVPGGDTVFFFQRPGWAADGRGLTCRLVVGEAEFWQKRQLGVGTRLANQEYRLEMDNLVYEAFELMVQNRHDGQFYDYQRREDFDNCTAKDEVYVLDLDGQRVLFGNCENGVAPDGEIRLLRVRVSAGSAGNIKAGTIAECESSSDLLVRQYEKTCGGSDRETVEECYQRLCGERKQVSRGVTSEDYETLVKQAPGLMILDCKAISFSAEEMERRCIPENEISLVVRPFCCMDKEQRAADERAGGRGHSQRKRPPRVYLSEAYRKNLEQMLWNKRLIGTSVKLLAPEYVGILVYAEIVIRPQFPDAEQRIEAAVCEYLEGDAWEIGRPVCSSVLYGRIDILPCVAQVKTLSLEAKGCGVRPLVNGDVQLPANGLPYLEELDLRTLMAKRSIGQEG